MADVLSRLEDATAGHAAAATSDDAVAGMPARWVARPASTAETAEVMRLAAELGLVVVPRGAGTKLGWGAPPEHVDLVLDTTRMDAVVEHAAGDLVVVVGAGRSLTDLQADLERAGQRLGVDPARRGTVGGAVATASTGPTRLFHGAVRDLVIGMRFVRADGVAAQAGGKVVKNVAGYDLGKLLTGSFGTLGVITEVAFRLHPQPATQRWVTCPVGEANGIQELVSAMAHSQVAPSAVELDRSPEGASLAVLLEGTGPGVEDRVAVVRRVLGSGASVSDSPPPWWNSEPPGSTGVLLKVTHEIAALHQLLEALDDASATSGFGVALRGSPLVGTALVALTSEVGGPSGELGVGGGELGVGGGELGVGGGELGVGGGELGVGGGELGGGRGELGAGTGELGAGRGELGAGRGELGAGRGELGAADRVRDFVTRLRASSARFGGTVVVLEAPAEVRTGLDVWGPVPSLSLMRSVKSQFDPERRLAPGRFVGGI